MTDRELIEQLIDRVAALEATLYQEERWLDKSRSSMKKIEFHQKGDVCPKDWLDVLFDSEDDDQLTGEYILDIAKKSEKAYENNKSKYLSPLYVDVSNLIKTIIINREYEGFVWSDCDDSGEPLFSMRPIGPDLTNFNPEPF